MTREELFRAVGEVREDQIEEAGTIKKQVHTWRRFGALAACLALILTSAAAAPWIKGQPQWKAIVSNFNPSAAETGNGGDTGDGTDAGSLDGLDGSYYRTDNPNRPTHPNYSTGVEIGELNGPGNGETMAEVSACLAWFSPEEIFSQDTVIFRGIVQELQYYAVTMGNIDAWYTRAIVEVTDSIRGDLPVGKRYSVLWMGAKGYMSTSISGALEDLDVGSDAIFMPIRTGRDTGWQSGSSYFCYADLAELYLSEGMRYVFADTGEGLNFERNTYPALVTAETLDEAAAYIRDMIGETERTQPAAVPATPQTEPPETRQAGPEEADPGSFSNGPGGARELPGGALIE